jgi:octaprenyl-diphosphate synthase
LFGAGDQPESGAASLLRRVTRVETRVLGPAAQMAGIRRLVSGKLKLVDAMFREHIESPVAIVDEIGGFVGDGEGKRVRPTLHLLCSRMCGYPGEHDVLLATVLEYIHTATLIHDDVIDEADTRRGRPSVNARWGNSLSVLFGDWLFAKAMDLALRAGSLEVMRMLAEVTLRMTEGEMLQTRYVGRIDLSVDEHLDMVERKTAALFGCCCEIAGVLADVDDSRRVALREYGTNLGRAFQLIDDLLDFTGDSGRLGKPAASDLREGKATLPVLDLLSMGDPQDRTLVRSTIAGDGEALARLRGRLEESGAIERSRRMAAQYAEAAVSSLACFDGTDARFALERLPRLLVGRDR